MFVVVENMNNKSFVQFCLSFQFLQLWLLLRKTKYY